MSEERDWDCITFLNAEQEVESSLNVSGSDAEILDYYPSLRYVILIKRNHILILKGLTYLSKFISPL